MIFGGARRRRRPHYLSSVLPLQVVLHDWLLLLFFLLSSFAVVVLDARIYVDIFEQDNKVYHHYEDHYRHLVLPSVAYFKVPNLDSSTPRWTQPHLLIKGFLRYYEGGGTDPGTTTSTSSTSGTINGSSSAAAAILSNSTTSVNGNNGDYHDNGNGDNEDSLESDDYYGDWEGSGSYPRILLAHVKNASSGGSSNDLDSIVAEADDGIGDGYRSNFVILIVDSTNTSLKSKLRWWWSREAVGRPGSSIPYGTLNLDAAENCNYRWNKEQRYFLAVTWDTGKGTCDSSYSIERKPFLFFLRSYAFTYISRNFWLCRAVLCVYCFYYRHYCRAYRFVPRGASSIQQEEERRQRRR